MDGNVNSFLEEFCRCHCAVETVGDERYLSWKVPMTRRQGAGSPADRPVKHDPDGPLLMQMQLQLRDLPRSSNCQHQLLRRKKEAVVHHSVRRTAANCSFCTHVILQRDAVVRRRRGRARPLIPRRCPVNRRTIR